MFYRCSCSPHSPVRRYVDFRQAFAGLLSRCFRDAIWVPRIRESRVHTGYLTFSLKKTAFVIQHARTR